MCYDFSKCYRVSSIQGTEVVVTVGNNNIFLHLKKNSNRLFYRVGCGVSNI
jgi:hypothetical protein